MHWVYLQATILLLVRRRDLRAALEAAAARHLCCELRSGGRRITRRYPGYPFAACSRVGSMVGLICALILAGGLLCDGAEASAPTPVLGLVGAAVAALSVFC